MIFWELQENFGKVAVEKEKAWERSQKCLIMLKSWTSVMTKGGKPGKWCDHLKRPWQQWERWEEGQDWKQRTKSRETKLAWPNGGCNYRDLIHYWWPLSLFNPTGLKFGYIFREYCRFIYFRNYLCAIISMKNHAGITYKLHQDAKMLIVTSSG